MITMNSMVSGITSIPLISFYSIIDEDIACVKNGILNSSINEDMKKFFIGLIDKKLGVFETPFKHQVDALEKFTQGRNLFVATGTGSGKTECFMWPMIYKLVNEAIHYCYLSHECSSI